MGGLQNPRDIASSLESQYLLGAYREMYLTVRTFHLLAEPGSIESIALEKFMSEQLFNENWTDKEDVKEKIRAGSRLLKSLVSGSLEKPSSLVIASKQTAPLKLTTPLKNKFKGSQQTTRKRSQSALREKIEEVKKGARMTAARPPFQITLDAAKENIQPVQ